MDVQGLDDLDEIVDLIGEDSPLVNEVEPVYHFSMQRKIKFYPRQAGTVSDRVREYSPASNQNPRTGNIAIERNVAYRRGIARPGNVIRAGRNTVALPHGAMFPVRLVAFFIEVFSAAGDVWLDPFLGAGTTIAAAHAHGRRGLGIEKKAEYVAVVLERLAGLGMKPRVLRAAKAKKKPIGQKKTSGGGRKKSVPAKKAQK